MAHVFSQLPYFYTLSRKYKTLIDSPIQGQEKTTTRKKWCTFFAFKLLSIANLAAFKEKRGISTPELLSRQIQFISNLHNADREQSVELRYIAFPGSQGWPQGRLEVVLICKLAHDNMGTSRRQAEHFWREMQALLMGEQDVYEFSPVNTEDDFRAVFEPFQVNDMGEILRREESVALRDGRSAYVACQFTWSLNSMVGICRNLLLQPEPSLVSITLKPTILERFEKKVLEDIISECEQEIQKSVFRVAEPHLQSQPSIAKVQYLDVKHSYMLQLRQLSQAFLMKIQVASEGKENILPSLLNVVGNEITRSAGTTEATIEASTKWSSYFSGGYISLRPLEAQEKEIALQNLKFQTFDIWADSVAPQDLGRLRFLVDPRQANCAFRFPLPIKEEVPGIKVRGLRISSAPPDIPKDGIFLGNNEYGGAALPIRLNTKDRRSHMYMVGQTGTGKTTLLLNMICSDICEGKGLSVIDPHGDLIEMILPRIPAERVEDVILFDPSDIKRPMGLNMLEFDLKHPEQKDFAIQEMISIFYKIWPDPSMLGPIFEQNMREAMLLIMEDKKSPGTLVDIIPCFTNEDFVKQKLKKVKDPFVKNFWEDGIPALKYHEKVEMVQYVVSKLGRFVENRTMRNILGQSHSSFNFRQMMDEGKIFLVNLSRGKLGDLNSALLGLIIVFKMQVAAMSRVDMPEEKRKDFYLYVDEFQNFTTDSFVSILSEARKYRLNLCIAHQFTSQLRQDIRDSVFGNVGTIVTFRAGPQDAKVLTPQLRPVFEEYDLMYMPNYNAVVKLLVNGQVIYPFSMKTVLPKFPEDKKISKKIRSLSRLKYGRGKEEVEEEIFERLGFVEKGSKKQELNCLKELNGLLGDLSEKLDEI